MPVSPSASRRGLTLAAERSRRARSRAARSSRRPPPAHRGFRFLAAVPAVALLGTLLLVHAGGVVQAAATVPTGFSDSIYASGFGGRLSTMNWSPDGRLFVSEKAGALRVVKNGVLLARPFVTVSANTLSERGLMGIAFDPNFATNHHLYVYYTYAATLKNRVSRFTQDPANPDVALAGSELVILDNIPSDSGMHNSGALHFGPVGKLYVSVGDSGSGPNAQNLAILPGKILRINADGSVPADNPFVGRANTRPEIWAYGLRNPFTFAFQPGTGRMFINDVGNATWEEVDEGARGANYGWPTCEGACSNPNFVNPIHAYSHAAGPGKAITGAVFYNGSQFPAAYANDYFFGDYVGNYIKTIDSVTGQVTAFATNAPFPVDLRVGPDGALYYLSVENHTISRIAFGQGPNPTPLPGSGEVSLKPAADDHVASTQPATNYGGSPELYVNSTGSINDAYLKWDLTPLAGKTITAAKLQFTTLAATWAGSAATQNVRLVANATWGEKTLTYNTRPPMSTLLGSITRTAPGTAYSVTLDTNALQPTAGHVLSIGVESVGIDDNLAFFSKDSPTDKPQLVIDYLTPTPPPVGRPPVPVISLPAPGTTYRAGDSIAFSGSASDPEDGALAASHLTWEVLFHHDTHTHPFLEPVSGITGGTLLLPDTGEPSATTFFRIHLRATDSDGNVSEVTRDITPLKSNVTLRTVPSGLALLLDGSPVTAPFTFTGVVRFKRQLTAPPLQTLNGVTYAFASWSDGGAADHTIATPGAATTFVATYVPALVLNPGADDHVTSLQPAVNHGLSPLLYAVKGQSIPYLSFNLTALAGKTVTSATLRIRTGADQFAGSTNTMRVMLVNDSTWGERTLTFNNRPPLSASLLGRLAAPAAKSTYDIVLDTALVQGKVGGRFSMAMDSTGTDSIDFFSRNSTTKPQLIITSR